MLRSRHWPESERGDGLVTRVKICGITRRKDAELAIALGADALGFIFEPSSPRNLECPPEWLTELPPYVARVAVFGPPPAEFKNPAFDAVQSLPGDFVTSPYSPRRVAVVRLSGGETPASVVAAATGANALLLDAYRPGSYGGGGIPVDWDLAAEIVQCCNLPVILAGGLTPENVRLAVDHVKPFAVDVSSGVEKSPGVKDAEKLQDFFAALH